VTAYENPYFLPLGYMADESLLKWNLSQSNPFLNQEDFYKRAARLNEPLFYALEPESVKLDNMTITSGGGPDGAYRYRPSDENKGISAVYRVTAVRDGPVYFYVRSPKIEKVKVTNLTFAALRNAGEDSMVSASMLSAGTVRGVSGNTSAALRDNTNNRESSVGPGAASVAVPSAATEHSIKYPYIIDAQYVRAGDDVEVELRFESSAADSFTLYAYYFDEDAFAGAWEKLSAQPLIISEYSDTRLDGVIDVKEPGLMYTSIPYSEGWSVSVDGAPAAVETVGNGALIAVRLPAGRHAISFRYMTPGLLPGALITLYAAFMLAGVTMLRMSRRAG